MGVTTSSANPKTNQTTSLPATTTTTPVITTTTTSSNQTTHISPSDASCASLSESCDKCAENLKCVWCPTAKVNNVTGACIDGNYLGPDSKNSDAILKQCVDWQWHFCFTRGRYLQYTALGIVGCILLCCIGCVCRCCLCRKKKPRKAVALDKFSKRADDDREPLINTKATKTS